MNDSIIAIDDEPDFLESIKRGLVSAGLKNLTLESNSLHAAALIDEGNSYDLALIDVTMPDMNGIALLEHIKSKSPETECIMITAVNEARVAVTCLKKGAYDYLTKPISRDDLLGAVKRALERKRLLEIIAVGKTRVLPAIQNKEAFGPIITRSGKMLRVMKEAELHAGSDVPILITGESGTGKELLARAIHLSSARSRFNFTSINMASISGNLFDAEFFGHTRGAFTGAEKERAGYLEHTDKGTLFLDEIGDLPADFQGKLLRVLQEGEFLKLGQSAASRVDIRFIAATNADVDRLMARGSFRKDLYYRLKGAWLHIPPLREHAEDIPLLIDCFLGELKFPQGIKYVDEEALSSLMAYNYPGNIRELKSIIQSAANLAHGDRVTPQCLPAEMRTRKKDIAASVVASSPAGKNLADVEKEYILNVYKETGQNKMQAARLLGLGLNTLRRKLASYNVD
ncbi:MAG TPA: sigma-54 dependent transcriptional regulator [Smithellaceae bacterium]|nr:sigma-54 dependent transcriptional regulator [Smithellaceae bacterium]